MQPRTSSPKICKINFWSKFFLQFFGKCCQFAKCPGWPRWGRRGAARCASAVRRVSSSPRPRWATRARGVDEGARTAPLGWAVNFQFEIYSPHSGLEHVICSITNQSNNRCKILGIVQQQKIQQRDAKSDSTFENESNSARRQSTLRQLTVRWLAVSQQSVSSQLAVTQ